MRGRKPTCKEVARLRRSLRFDGGFYLRRYPDVAAVRLDPFWHFLLTGAAEGRQPHRGCEVAAQLAALPADEGRLHPLVQYVLEGPLEARAQLVDSHPVRILLDTPRGVHLGENLGDVAMCAGAMLRLSELAPGCQISVVVDDPRPLAFTDLLFEAIPSAARLHWMTQPTYPGGRRFAEAFLHADLIATTGHGALLDFMMDDTLQRRHILLAGHHLGARTALLGHGLGPLRDPALRRIAAEFLPKLDLLCVRERRDAPALLAELGVPLERVIVAGDDATRLCVPPWSGPLPKRAPRAIGLSLRTAYGVAPERIPALAAVAQTFAAREGLEVVPLPIDGDDVATLARAGHPCALGTDPPAFMREAARCGVVLAGSYHAAVLSLAQGVPTVALCADAFYRSKMGSLAAWFPSGCRVVDLADDAAGANIAGALEWAWARDMAARQQLVEAARHQITLGDRALAGLLQHLSVAPTSLRRRFDQRLAYLRWPSRQAGASSQR